MTEEQLDAEVGSSVRPSIVRMGIRLGVMVGALAVAGVVLINVFDALEPGEVRRAIASLTDAELISLGAMWILWLASQGMQTASLLRELPVRRGIVAFLGPAGVAAVIPGPSDLPVRQRMFRSWGFDSARATLAVAAGGLFSIGTKLLLPIVAVMGLVVSGAPIDGALQTIVVITALVSVAFVVIGFVLASEPRTARAGELIDPVWRAVLRLLRRSPGEALAGRLVAARASALDTLRGRWLIASWAAVLTAGTRFALLLMAVRFMAVAGGDLRWTQVFVVYAIVQGLTIIPVTAGDAGVSEVALIGLLTAAAGATYVSQITAAVVIFRVLTWLSIIPLGLGTLGAWRLAHRRRTDRFSPE